MPKKTIKIAINGFGRIGRCFMRAAWDNPHFEIAAVNSRSEIQTYAHLLKYDSVYGIWDKDIKVKNEHLVIDGRAIPFFHEIEPSTLPWAEKKIDLVVESTRDLGKREQVDAHRKAGADYVLVTAPMKDPDITLVMGVNEQKFNPKKHKGISAASCTSVCAALITEVLEKQFGISKGFFTTVHAFTADQSLIDSSHRDLRRARAATESIIPTSTGVTATIGQLFPRLGKKISGLSLRIPLIIPSVLNFTVELKKKSDAASINRAFKQASKKELRGMLAVTDEPLVSVDFKQNPHGAIVDLLSTTVVDENLANVVAWYDNEWGYVAQLSKLLEYLAKRIAKS